MYLDFINLLTYGFHEDNRQLTSADAPLYPKENATGTDLEYTVEYAVNYWLENGVDHKKIVWMFVFRFDKILILHF